MTTIFPLECYPTIYAASLLFQNEDVLITNNSLKNIHRFWKERKEHTYIQEQPVTELSINSKDPFLHSLGVKIIDDSSNSLFIVPDEINALTLKELLDSNDEYLYRSVYHYWNYLSQLQNSLPIDRPIIFLDLNQVSSEKYISLRLIQREGSRYLVPVLDKRTADTIKLQYDSKNIYDQIIQNVATDILKNYPKDDKTLQHLTKYLKKIRLFQCDLNSPLRVELLYQGKIYHKLVQLKSLQLTPLRTIITSINNLANQHTDYHFVVISDYNIRPGFRNAFTSNNIVVPDASQNYFTNIWQERRNTRLSLYGQYLDQIEFMFKSGWFKILSPQESDQIYYEGDTQTRTFTACLTDANNQIKNTFSLSAKEVSLPIKINEQKYCKNNIPQAYYITYPQGEQNQNIDNLTPITIQIELIVRIGSVPQLRVRNVADQSIIETDMRDIVTTYYKCISLADIREKRRQDIQRIPNPERVQEVIINLSLYNFSHFNYADRTLVIRQVEESMSTRNRIYEQLGRSTDLLLNISPDLEENRNIQKVLTFKIITEISALIVKYAAGTFNIPTSFNPEERSHHKQNIINWTILIGKTYRFLPLAIVENFFQQSVIVGGLNSRRIGQEFSRCLARLARERQFQLTYFNIFNTQLNQDKIAYKVDHYIWGYWRILRWYSEFDYSKFEIDYSSHFTLLLKHLLSAAPGRNYLQDAFLCLIYLLTFRETNASFCIQNSPEYTLAQNVIERYQNEDIRQSALPNNTLVGYFQEYLEGTSQGEAELLNIY